VSIQDQYTTSVRQTQEAWTGIVESLTDNVQAFTKNISPVPTVDPTAAIDQVFDFWAKALETQRDALKQFAGASVAAGDRVREQVEQVSSVVREQGESVKQVARAQAETTERIAREQAEAADRAEREVAEAADRAEREQAEAADRAKREQARVEREQARAKRDKAASKFEDLTKAELQEELAGRDLPKTGNVDELRERLVADELK
jgi:hypothetical protein